MRQQQAAEREVCDNILEVTGADHKATEVGVRQQGLCVLLHMIV